MKLPILVDNTDTTLFWERANIDIVLKHGFGQRIKKFSQLKPLLTSYLNDEGAKEQRRRVFAQAPSSQFHVRIPEIIREMLEMRFQNISANESNPLEPLHAQRL